MALVEGASDGLAEHSPRLPGAGSQRARSAIELYARLVFPPVGTLVVDSLTRYFKGNGATVKEFEVYLGLPTALLEQALNWLPMALIYSSADVLDTTGPQGDGSASDDDNDQRQRRFYINYRTALPFVSAHMRSMLLPLCRLEVPTITVPSGSSNSSAAATMAKQQVGRSNDGTAYYCTGCSSWRDGSDLRPPLHQCSICNNDVLASTLAAARAAWDALLPTPHEDGACISAMCAKTSPEGHPIPYAFRMDRFAVQQALAALYLFKAPFCFVDTHAVIVDPDAVMTKAEFDDRAQHRSSLALQFRAKHRGGLHLHVQMAPPLEHQEHDKRHMNAVRLEKHRSLPPWLAPPSLPHDAAPSSSCGDGTTALGPTGQKRPRSTTTTGLPQVCDAPWQRMVCGARASAQRHARTHPFDAVGSAPEQQYDVVFHRTPPSPH